MIKCVTFVQIAIAPQCRQTMFVMSMMMMILSVKLILVFQTSWAQYFQMLLTNKNTLPNTFQNIPPSRPMLSDVYIFGYSILVAACECTIFHNNGLIQVIYSHAFVSWWQPSSYNEACIFATLTNTDLFHRQEQGKVSQRVKSQMFPVTLCSNKPF